MNTFKWLMRREWWEHRGMFLWMPTAISALIILLISAAVVFGNSPDLGGPGQAEIHIRDRAGDVAALAYMILAIPFYLCMAGALFFYCINSLSDERQDRSILFWKSLPVSDFKTVLSKLATATVLVPLLVSGIITATLFVLLPILGYALERATGAGFFSALLMRSDVYVAPFKALSLLPVYILWGLPTFGWLMLVSSWARSKVGLWALGVPLASIVILKAVNTAMDLHMKVDWIIQNVILRSLAGVFPGIWMGFARVDSAALVVEGHDVIDFNKLIAASWNTLATPDVLFGAVAGLAMLYAAVYMRRHRADA